METVWFVLVTVMLAMYVVLDGFDFGGGMVCPFIARTKTERRTVLATIGPVWNANEVWLIAAGAVLFCAYPKAYAAGFSGFYLALILVLWLLIFRCLAVELREQIDHVLWLGLGLGVYYQWFASGDGFRYGVGQFDSWSPLKSRGVFLRSSLDWFSAWIGAWNS